MEFKGTNGEWNKFDIYNHSHHHTWFKISVSKTDDPAHGESICNITTRNAERAEANAKLITAAPELLSVLQEITDELSPVFNEISPDHYQRAKKAIKKAIS